jgi:predicted ATPase
MDKNKWYVITGGPSSGKTTVLNLLKKQGYKTTDEIARTFIERELKLGKTIEEIRKDEINFQLLLIDLKIELENELSKQDTIFFDRGMHDTIAYLLKQGYQDKKHLDKIGKLSKYKKVFIFDLLTLVKDYARTESADDAILIDRLLDLTYRQYGFDVVRVPVMNPKKRMEFILNNL